MPAFITDENHEPHAELTFFVNEVETKVQIAFLSLDDLSLQIKEFLAHADFKAKRAYAPRTGNESLEGKKAIVESVEPVDGKRWFIAKCFIVDANGEPTETIHKQVIFTRTELRKGDYIILSKDDRGFYKYELTSEFEQEDLPF